MTRFNRYDYHNLQFLYQQRFRNPRNVVKMREYVENNLNQKDISRVCSGLKIKYRFPTKLILFQANGKKAERQFYKFYKKIM
uniref:Transposase n=1 Tax=Strongyloides stercoralis TaxID=6248 RepID=A0A0K0ERP4_STRER